MAIVSESRSGLQSGLDALEQYCDRWGLSVNVNKTTCVAFRNGGRVGKLDTWSFKNENIETVNSFKYLGFVFGGQENLLRAYSTLPIKALKPCSGLKKSSNSSLQCCHTTR